MSLAPLLISASFASLSSTCRHRPGHRRGRRPRRRRGSRGCGRSGVLLALILVVLVVTVVVLVLVVVVGAAFLCLFFSFWFLSSLSSSSTRLFSPSLSLSLSFFLLYCLSFRFRRCRRAVVLFASILVACVQAFRGEGRRPPLRLGTVTTSSIVRGLLITQAGPLPGDLSRDGGASWVAPFPNSQLRTCSRWNLAIISEKSNKTIPTTLRTTR